MDELKVGNWICFGYKTENETISGVVDLITDDAIFVKMDSDGVPCGFSKEGIFILMNQEI